MFEMIKLSLKYFVMLVYATLMVGAFYAHEYRFLAAMIFLGYGISRVKNNKSEKKESEEPGSVEHCSQTVNN